MEVLRINGDIDNQIIDQTLSHNDLENCDPTDFHNSPPSTFHLEKRMRRESPIVEQQQQQQHHRLHQQEGEKDDDEEGEGEAAAETAESRRGFSATNFSGITTESGGNQLLTSIPEPVFTLFAFLARQGVHISDLFRRPGNINQMKVISASLAKGEVVNWSDYNVYTVANVAKRFLLSVPGGIFGEHNERRLLEAAVPSQGSHSTLQRVASSDATATSGQPRIPTKLQHSSGIFHIESIREPTPVGGDAGSGGDGSTVEGVSLRHQQDVFVIGLISDKTGFLCDFGIPPPTQVERRQMDIFVEILESLPAACRELAIVVLGILHSMVRHAGFEATTGCHSCASSATTPPPSAGAQASSSVAAAAAAAKLVACASSHGPHCSMQQSPPIRTLAEAVAKSVAGALLHTCPLSVDLVDRGAKILQTLILRYAHLGERVTAHYTNLLLGHVSSPAATNTETTTTAPPISQVVSEFVVRPSASRPKKLRGWRGVRTKESGPVEEEKNSAPVGRILSIASRLLCLTRNRLASGDGSQSPKSSAGLREVPTTQPTPMTSPAPATVAGHAHYHPNGLTTLTTIAEVSATATEAAPAVREESPKEENEESEGTEHAQILTLSYIRRSRSRYHAVHRRQMEAMLRRTAWFLSPPVPASTAVFLPRPSIEAPELVVSSHGVALAPAPTSTQSLLEISISPDLETHLTRQQQRPEETEPQGLGVPFYLSPLPRVSVMSIRSAPTCQTSSITPCQVDSGPEDNDFDEDDGEGLFEK